MTLKPYLKEYVNYNPKIGTEALHIIGIPGTGKSNIGFKVFHDCIAKGECGLLRGDRFSEWRHYLNYKAIKNITILIPKDANIVCKDIPAEIEKTFQFVDFSQLQITDYLQPHEIVVCYDNCYDLASRAWFWIEMFEQCLERTEDHLYNIPIAHMDHEAGVIWPEIAQSDRGIKKGLNHWKAVARLCELFVEFRKALIRPIFLSQLEGEIKWQLRLKCMWQIYRQGRASDQAPKPVKKSTVFQRIDQFIVVVGGGLYSRENTIPEFKEIETVWRMIPRRPYLKYKSPYMEEDAEEEPTHECQKCGYQWAARVNQPKRCPDCASRKIEEMVMVVTSPTPTSIEHEENY